MIGTVDKVTMITKMTVVKMTGVTEKVIITVPHHKASKSTNLKVVKIVMEMVSENQRIMMEDVMMADMVVDAAKINQMRRLNMKKLMILKCHLSSKRILNNFASTTKLPSKWSKKKVKKLIMRIRLQIKNQIMICMDHLKK